ncbi:hypothetical protein BCR35DRAFT_304657 [Leucosporidium creatinivorum]|uniref:Uncharacterized protein n=1 Tax=Leucosporidium creatinivorum TaxID=106004 RepID=A0A1Y2F7F0_9BASI|nr:hypothetical protein BCR35DRAFT_304657 [Leucosporidium creatinivorum]
MPVNPELFNTLTGVEIASQSFSDAVVGPPVVGWTVELVLYGVVLSTTLAYVYSPLFAKDSRYIRMLLAAVIILETVQSGFNFYSLWHFSTLQHRDALSLWHLTEFDTMSTLFLGWEGALVQGFLATRVASLLVTQWHRHLLGSWLYVAYTVRLHEGRLHQMIPIRVAEAMWLWGTAAVALSITGGMINYVLKRPAGLAPADRGLRKVFRVASEIALPTTLAATVGAVLQYSLRRTHGGYNSSSAFFQPLCSFYALSLLTSLSTRNLTDNIVTSVATLWYAQPEEQGLPADDQRKSGGGGGGSLYETKRSAKAPLEADEEQLPPMEVLMTVARLRDVYMAQQQEEHTVGFTTPQPRPRMRADRE